MAEVDLDSPVDLADPLPVDVSDRCARLLGQLCVAGSPIDPRAIRALTFLTDSVDVSGSNINIINTPDVNITDRCARLLGQTCVGGVPIDPRDRNWDLDFATDQVNISGSTVDVTDRCARSLGQLCVGGVPIDPRDRNWDLNFATDQVDVSGSTVTTLSGSLVTMEDAFMELRLMADMLKDIPLAIDSSARMRTFIDAVSPTTTIGTNIINIGGITSAGYIFDEMDIVFNTGTRTNCII